jgi:hypothetical protein
MIVKQGGWCLQGGIVDRKKLTFSIKRVAMMMNFFLRAIK